MALKIDSSSLVTKRYLLVRSDGVKFYESKLLGSTRQFRFSEIECVLLSAQNLLSFQVGQEVFSIEMRPDKTKHQDTLATLINEVRRAHGLVTTQ